MQLLSARSIFGAMSPERQQLNDAESEEIRRVLERQKELQDTIKAAAQELEEITVYLRVRAQITSLIPSADQSAYEPPRPSPALALHQSTRRRSWGMAVPSQPSSGLPVKRCWRKANRLKRLRWLSPTGARLSPWRIERVENGLQPALAGKTEQRVRAQGWCGLLAVRRAMA